MMITCSDCQRTYKNKDSLKSHRHRVHKNENSSNIRFEPYSTNNYKCEQCDEGFPLLAALYRHRQKHHPAIAIINHSSHEDEKSDEVSGLSNQNKIIPISTNPPIPVLDTDPKPIKRRISDTDSEISFNVLESPSKIKSRFEPHPSKKVKYNIDSDYSADDEEDGEDKKDENKNFSGGRALKQLKRYKIMYQKCLRDLRILRGKFEVECQKRLDDKEQIIISLQKTIVSLNNEKKDYGKKIKLLQKYIAKFSEDKSHFNNISKAIFNCVSIGEINKLRKLFKEKKYDELLKDESVKVIQKIFTGLVNGVIPVCNPQRTVMSKEERDMVDKIEESSTKDAKRLLRKNKEMVGQLFNTIDSSIKMVVDLYYQFGSRDEDNLNDSDSETDDEYEKDDEYSSENEQSNLDIQGSENDGDSDSSEDL